MAFLYLSVYLYFGFKSKSLYVLKGTEQIKDSSSCVNPLEIRMSFRLKYIV